MSIVLWILVALLQERGLSVLLESWVALVYIPKGGFCVLYLLPTPASPTPHPPRSDQVGKPQPVGGLCSCGGLVP